MLPKTQQSAGHQRRQVSRKGLHAHARWALVEKDLVAWSRVRDAWEGGEGGKKGQKRGGGERERTGPAERSSKASQGERVQGWEEEQDVVATGQA